MYLLRFAMKGLAQILPSVALALFIKRLNCAATCHQRRSDDSIPTRAAVVVLSQDIASHISPRQSRHVAPRDRRLSG